MTVPELDVRIGDQRIQRIQRLNLRFGLELADSFELVSAERASVSAGDPITISVDGRPVLAGRVMGRRKSRRVGDSSTTWSGHSGAQVLVKSSIVQPRRTWSEISLRSLAETLVLPFGFGVEVDPSLEGDADLPFDTIRSDVGETVFAFLARAATRAGCIITSGAAVLGKDEAPRSTVLLTRVGSRRSEAPITVPSERVLEWDSEEDWRDLHSHYYVNTRGGGRLDTDGTLVGADGTAEDERVPYSPIIIQAIAGGHQKKKRSKKTARSQSELDRQAEWEMRRRAAEASRRSVVIAGWSPAATGTGTLWSPNTVVQFVDLEDGTDDDLLISSVELSFDIGNEATVARLELLPPDAFSVFEQPKIRKSTKAGKGSRGYRVDPDYMAKHGTLAVSFDDRGKPKPAPPTLFNAFLDEFAEKDSKKK